MGRNKVVVTVFVWREGNKYIAYEPVTGTASQGDTREEALRNIAEAVAMVLEAGEEYYEIEDASVEKVEVEY